MRRKVCLLALTVLLLLSSAISVSAAGFDSAKTGSISVKLEKQDENNKTVPVKNAEFDVYHVATVGITSDKKLMYAYTNAFKDCNIALNDTQLATKLSKYVEEKIIDSKRIVTNEKGVAVYDKLPLGLYFVKQVNVVEGFTVCTPFLVTVPMKTDTGYVYDINATPKTDIAKLVTITVKKEWVADKSKIPSSVTVELLKDGKVIETATLTESKDWTVTFEKMPQGEYDLKEVSVPKGFESKVVKKGYQFTVTNKYILAQTGQLVWPIPVFALAGILFLLAGFVILRKPGKQDA